MKSLAGQPWLQIVATTRLDPGNFAAASMTAIPVDDLPMDDALALLRRARPFADEAEAQAARRVVDLLGGFTLGIELVGAYLADRQEVTYESYLARLEAEGLSGADALAGDTKTAARIRHREKQIGRMVDDTLATLPDAAREVLAHAALFPPDQIVAKWLRMVVAEALPEYNEDSVNPGYADPWEELLRDLGGRRLLPLASTSKNVLPTLRMHRLVGQHLTASNAPEQTAERWRRIENLVERVRDYIEKTERHAPREVAPLIPPFAALSERAHRVLDNRTTAGALSCLVGILLRRGFFVRAQAYSQASLATCERLARDNPDSEFAQRDLSSGYINVGDVLFEGGDLAGARARYEQSLTIQERFARDYPDSV